MGPEVPSRARRALPALRRSENEDGHRPSECSRIQNADSLQTIKMDLKIIPIYKLTK